MLPSVQLPQGKASLILAGPGMLSEVASPVSLSPQHTYLWSSILRQPADTCTEPHVGVLGIEWSWALFAAPSLGVPHPRMGRATCLPPLPRPPSQRSRVGHRKNPMTWFSSHFCLEHERPHTWPSRDCLSIQGRQNTATCSSSETAPPFGPCLFWPSEHHLFKGWSRKTSVPPVISDVFTTTCWIFSALRSCVKHDQNLSAEETSWAGLSI